MSTAATIPSPTQSSSPLTDDSSTATGNLKRKSAEIEPSTEQETQPAVQSDSMQTNGPERVVRKFTTVTKHLQQQKQDEQGNGKDSPIDLISSSEDETDAEQKQQNNGSRSNSTNVGSASHAAASSSSKPKETTNCLLSKCDSLPTPALRQFISTSCASIREYRDKPCQLMSQKRGPILRLRLASAPPLSSSAEEDLDVIPEGVFEFRADETPMDDRGHSHTYNLEMTSKTGRDTVMYMTRFFKGNPAWECLDNLAEWLRKHGAIPPETVDESSVTSGEFAIDRPLRFDASSWPESFREAKVTPQTVHFAMFIMDQVYRKVRFCRPCLCSPEDHMERIIKELEEEHYGDSDNEEDEFEGDEDFEESEDPEAEE